MPWHELTLSSEALRDNPLGDPHERPLFVWAPVDSSQRYPSVYVLHAHMRSARSWFNVTPFERSYPDEIEARQPEAVVVLVDGWTAVGGSQWIDSAGIGRYQTYLCDEVVPFVDGRFPTAAEPGARGVQGKSSGGFGAVHAALERPEIFSAFAAHAPDSLFEVTVANGFPAAARALRDRYDGSLERFWSEFRGLATAADALLVELSASARAYSEGELPFEIETGLRRPELWARWLAHDPVPIAAGYADVLARSNGVWLDAGDADEYFLDLGATALRAALLAAGLPEERLRFELYEGRHGGGSWRYPLSLEWLVACLSMTLGHGSPNPTLR